MTNEPKFYNTQEAANLLGVNIQTMRRYLREGRVRAVRIGRDWRVSQATFDELASRAQVTPAEIKAQP